MTTPAPTMPARYIWQHPDWPKLGFDAQALAPDLNQARLQQGRLLGLLDAIGLAEAQEITRELWVQEAVATAAIEGEQLDLAAVRSSVAYRLGLADAPTGDRHVDGLVEVMQDATDGFASVLDGDRLCRWQSALFPGGTSGLRRIAVGRWRDHADPMQIVSGRPGREVVHYTAPASSRVAGEMARFLAWFEATRPASQRAVAASPDVPATTLNGIARAAVAHLWFESIHPFEDGNGRLGRAIVDMALAQDVGAPARLFGMSRQLLVSRSAYYDALSQAQSGPPEGALDVTPWVQWFVQAFTRSCILSQAAVKQALDKAAFRLRMSCLALNARQIKVLMRLLEAGSTELGGGFLGGMTAEKYGKISATSKATATRDLAELLQHGLLRVEGVGKATRYAVNVAGWNQPVTR
ncbi:Fic family protein [Polaromonas hydrogenivorans]